MIEAGAAAPASATPDPPVFVSMLASAQHGDLSELRSKSKVFLQVDDPTGRKAIIEEIAKYRGLTLVSAEAEADFLVSYGNERLNGKILTGEMVVFSKTDDPAHPIRIYWHTAKIQLKAPLVLGPAGRSPEVNAVRDLIKAFKKIKGEN